MDQLLPQPEGDVGHRRRDHALGAGRDLGQGLDARAHAPVHLAEGQIAPVVEVAHRAVRRQGRLDLGQAAEHALGAEAPLQGFDMGHAVQHRQHRGAGVDRRADGGDRVRQVVGLAGEQHDVPARRRLFRREQRHRAAAERAVGALDHQPVGFELGAAAGADQKGDLGARFQQPPAEIAAEGAGPEHQDPHRALSPFRNTPVTPAPYMREAMRRILVPLLLLAGLGAGLVWYGAPVAAALNLPWLGAAAPAPTGRGRAPPPWTAAPSPPPSRPRGR